MWSLQQARDRVHRIGGTALAGVPQRVSGNGKAGIIVLSDAPYHDLLKAARHVRTSLADHLLAFPGGGLDCGEVKPRPL